MLVVDSYLGVALQEQLLIVTDPVEHLQGEESEEVKSE